jgi:hypothetical protein
MQKFDPIEIRAFGYLGLAFSVPLLILFLANMRSGSYYGGSNYSFLLGMAIYAGVTGFGLVRLRKWGAVLLLLGTAVCELTIIVLSILRWQVPGSWAGIPWVILFAIPSALILPSWATLK